MMNLDVIILYFVGKITRSIGLKIEYNKKYKEMWQSGRLSTPRILFRLNGLYINKNTSFLRVF